VETLEELKKRIKDRHLDIRRRGQPKKRKQGSGGSRKNLVAASRMMTAMLFLLGVRDKIVRNRPGQCCKTSP
jgi:hypothetical protein